MIAERRTSGHRAERLEQILLEEVGSLLRDEARDPRLGDVSTTRVELSVDYKSARVFYVLPEGVHQGAVERALVRATPFLRARLAEALALKQVPALRFVHDRLAEQMVAEDLAEPASGPARVIRSAR